MDKMQEDIVALWMVSGVIDLLLWNYIDGVYIPQLLCFCVIIKHFFFFFEGIIKHFTLQWISTVYEKGKKKNFGSPKLTTSHSKLRVDPNNPKIKIVTWPICVLY